VHSGADGWMNGIRLVFNSQGATDINDVSFLENRILEDLGSFRI
jgi:hypothetical protein